MRLVEAAPPARRAEELRAEELRAELTARARLAAGTALRVGWLGFTDHLAEAGLREPASGRELPVLLHGRSALVGPPHRDGGPCWLCLARRWQALRPDTERDALELGSGVHAVHDTPYLTGFAVTALVHLVEEAVRQEPAAPLVYELRLDTLLVTRHPLIADPLCPNCARRGPEESAELHLVSRRKTAVDAYRLRSVLDYDLPVDAYVNPVCGVLGPVALRAYDSPTTAPVTGYTRIRSTIPLFEFFWSGHADSYERSAVLGVLEGLERYAGLRARGRPEPVLDSYTNLSPHALDPRECGVYAEEFYRDAGFYQPFDPGARLNWVWGYSLRDRRALLVPEQIVYYLGRHGQEPTFVMECSNGCASGSCLEEAVLFGMLELIERDAFLLAWYGRAPLPEIDPGTCRDPATHAMIDRVSLLGYDIRLFDARIDLAVPVVAGCAVKRDGGLGTLCFAAGASLDPEEAVRAALCEIASYVPGFTGRVAEAEPEVRAMMADYRRVSELRHHPLLFGLPEMAGHADFLLRGGRPLRSMEETYVDYERRRPRTLDLLDDLRYCQDQLTAAGFDVIVVDQTCPEQRAAGLRTVCVLAPGLVPIDFGWRRQRVLTMPRLRTAFRRAGLRATDLEPADFHLVPHPFP